MADIRYVDAEYFNSNYTVYTANATFTQDPYIEGETYVFPEYILDKRKLTATLTASAEDLDLASANLTTTATMNVSAVKIVDISKIIYSQPYDTLWEDEGTWNLPRQEIWQERVSDNSTYIARPVVPNFNITTTLNVVGVRTAEIVDLTINDFASISIQGTYFRAGGASLQAAQANITSSPSNIIRTLDKEITAQTSVSSRGTYQILGSATLNNTMLIDTPDNTRIRFALNEILANNLNLNFTGTRLRRHEKTLNATATLTRNSATSNRDVTLRIDTAAASVSAEGKRFPGPHLLELNIEAQIPFNNGGYLIEIDKQLSSTATVNTAGRIYIIDPYRIYVVDSETRLLAVDQELRQKTINSETRLNIIPQETRGLTIKSETRTLEVQNLILIDNFGPRDRRE